MEENYLIPQENKNFDENERLFMTSVITGERLEDIKPGQFNVMCAPRGSGKTTWALSEEIINFAARDKKHIVYLIHTKLARDAICATYPEVTCAFTDKDMNGWFLHRHKNMWSLEEDVNKVHVMCYQTFSALICKDIEWLDDIDLIVWDEFDDIEQYYWQEVENLRKRLPDLTEEGLIATLKKGKHTSIPAFIYNIQTIILEPARIRLVAMSATPELAAPLFGDYVNYIIKGEINEIYDAQRTIYIESVAAALREGIITPKENMCPWVFTERIGDIMRLAELFRAQGFNPLLMWSYGNEKWKINVTDKMRVDVTYVKNTGLVPKEYNCVITNQVAGRSLNIVDERFQDWICDSIRYSNIGQFIRARYEPARKYILNKARGLISFVREDTHFPAIYYTWHSREELKELLKEQPIYTRDFKTQLTNWNAVKKEWEEEINFDQKRYGAKHLMHYRIIGVKEDN